MLFCPPYSLVDDFPRAKEERKEEERKRRRKKAGWWVSTSHEIVKAWKASEEESRALAVFCAPFKVVHSLEEKAKGGGPLLPRFPDVGHKHQAKELSKLASVPCFHEMDLGTSGTGRKRKAKKKDLERKDPLPLSILHTCSGGLMSSH